MELCWPGPSRNLHILLGTAKRVVRNAAESKKGSEGVELISPTMATALQSIAVRDYGIRVIGIKCSITCNFQSPLVERDEYLTSDGFHVMT